MFCVLWNRSYTSARAISQRGTLYFTVQNKVPGLDLRSPQGAPDRVVHHIFGELMVAWLRWSICARISR